MVTVSVFIPTRNRLVLLQRAIASILASPNFAGEIVVSDNSSNEATAEWLATLSEPRLRSIRWTEALSKPEHWSRAAEACRGELLFKLDDDDTIAPDFLAKGVAYLHAHRDAVAVYTGYTLCAEGDPTGKNFSTKTFIDQAFWSDTNPVDGVAYLRAVLLNEGGYPRNQKTAGLFRRAAGHRLGWFRHASEDFAFSAALGFCGRIGYIPEPLYQWHWHQANGVHDLVTTYRLSRQAIRDCAHFLPLAEACGITDWPTLLVLAERNVRLFYLVIALTQRGPAERRQFIREIEADPEIVLDSRWTLLRNVGRFVPAFSLRWALELYQSQPGMTGVLRRLFFLGTS